jgi:PRTRC genetic system protein B
MSIDTDVSLGGQSTAHLNKAVLIYGQRSSGWNKTAHAFCTVHDVHAQDGHAALGAGRLLTHHELGSLVAAVYQQKFEMIPENVIALGPSRIAWFERSSLRPLFFKPHEKDPALSALSGLTFPQPALLWITSPANLSVYALEGDERPTPKTKLFKPPYWNVFTTHKVCMGSMPVPEDITYSSIKAWSAAFFASRFTHNAGGMIVNTAGSYTQFLESIRGLTDFPRRALVKTKRTLEDVIKNG